MAEGFLASFNPEHDIFSAGTYPSSVVNPLAIRVMFEAGIDISENSPESVDKYLVTEWDYVITVCDNARETCPVFIGKVRHRLHMGFEDPSEYKGTPEEVLIEFRRIRDEIRHQFYSFYLENLA